MATKKSVVYAPRLKTLYDTKLVDKLEKELGVKNRNQLPKLSKIVVSSGIGRKKDDKRFRETVNNTLAKITGQKPIDRMAKKSIANFKTRAGQNVIGASVTLRNQQMYEFLDRFINVVLPRVRDFRGVSNNSFDASGNYSIGIEEQSVFPELTFEETQILHGLQVTFVIKNGSAEASKALLTAFGMPFEKLTKKGDK
ncbi:MAG: 50S ribosomal protein L5 [Candidatus Nanosyncoccaceae bacterium]|jgi:large subunit ribosomal protein L5